MATGDVTQGRRIHPVSQDEAGHRYFRPEPGDYYLDEDGGWSAVTPNGLHGKLANHDVVEHEDGTITVSPSILVEGTSRWHGYLERGTWREV